MTSKTWHPVFVVDSAGNITEAVAVVQTTIYPLKEEGWRL
jgi:hypothetical protein